MHLMVFKNFQHDSFNFQNENKIEAIFNLIIVFFMFQLILKTLKFLYNSYNS